MNKVMLNTVHLDGAPIIKKGSGGGGNSGGGGGTTPDMPVIGDGKTYLYIKYPNKRLSDIALYFSQSVSRGVTVDWGDESEPVTAWGTGSVGVAHRYAEEGDYVISLNPAEGCTLGFGYATNKWPILGNKDISQKWQTNLLQSVEVGRSVTSIGDYAFYDCYSLSSIVIPESVTSIGIYAFYGCYSLSSIVIPESVTSIGNYAFYGCYSLSSIVIPESVTSIGDRAFYECYSLSSIVIPESVTSIGDRAFYYCRSLSSIVVQGSVTSIGNYAFDDCRSLSSIVVQGSVTSIGDYAFYDCYGLRTLNLSKCTSVPTLGGTNVFRNAANTIVVVPDALYDEWIAATNWSKHASKIVKASEFNA